MPARSIKNEYHKRVSPIVRIGGRPRVMPNATIKPPKTNRAASDNTIATEL